MPSSPPETRASLILRLPNAADAAAWDEFVLVYGPLVFRVARRQGLQPTDADDLVQEVFSAAAKQVGDWLQRPDRGRFRAWLLRIARNIAVNLLTRKPFGATGVGGDEADGRLEHTLQRRIAAQVAAYGPCPFSKLTGEFAPVQSSSPADRLRQSGQLRRGLRFRCRCRIAGGLFDGRQLRRDRSGLRRAGRRPS